MILPRALLLLLLPCTACKLTFEGSPELPTTPPPLAGMREPLDLQDEPADEEERLALPPGSFSGMYVADARGSLEALVGEPEGVVVARVVENSPADAAGLAEGDLLLEAQVAGGEARALSWPSVWRELELETPAGTTVSLRYDRAGVEQRAEIVLAQRVHPAARDTLERLREDQRVGVVVRGATEVEARRHARGPGAGAVVVGLSVDSPWRAAGVRYRDWIVAVDGAELGDPEALIEAVRRAEPDSSLRLRLLRAGTELELDAPLSQRAAHTQLVHIPLIFRYEAEPDRTTTSALLGLYRLERTPAVWRLRLLWFLRFQGGDADKLEPVES